MENSFSLESPLDYNYNENPIVFIRVYEENYKYYCLNVLNYEMTVIPSDNEYGGINEDVNINHSNIKLYDIYDLVTTFEKPKKSYKDKEY